MKSTKKSNSHKLIIIGLDGATFDVLDPYIKKGILPNIEFMIREGTWGKLESSIPPVTGPSWVSFMTGMWPGKHGIYDFVKPKPGSIKRQAVSYHDIRTSTLWGYLTDSGKKVGIVNLPITYPPPEVDGFVIPGLLTPDTEGEFAYPKGLMAEIQQAVGKYIHDVWWQRYGEKGIENFLNELSNCTNQRIKTFSYLLENKQWDLFMGVFIGTDRIQHYLWPYIHPEQERHLTKNEKKIVSMVAEYYKQIDDFFGKLLKKFGSMADIITISDHGFGPLYGKMYINRWLEDNGYLTVNHRQARVTSKKRQFFNLVRTIIKTLDFWNIRKMFGLKKRLHRMSAYDFLDCIEWSKTLAYSVSNTEQGIYINLNGREPDGIVNDGEYSLLRDEIILKLKELKDSKTGERIVTQIFKREDLYEGPCVKDAPDIIFFLKDGEWLLDVQLKTTLCEDAGWHTGFGTHRSEGIFIGYGSNIKKGVEIAGARIIDIAPTILYQQGLPIPAGMDGKPLLGIFDDVFLNEHSVSYIEEIPQPVKVGYGHGLSESEMENIEMKLKGLGYL